MAQTFHQFSKLPTEIRLQVWKIHSNIPRVVRLAEMTLDFNGRTYELVQAFHTVKDGCEKTCHPPALLSVNQESRLEGLRYYTLQVLKTTVRETTDGPSLVSGNSLAVFEMPFRGFYVNQAMDCVYTTKDKIARRFLRANLDCEVKLIYLDAKKSLLFSWRGRPRLWEGEEGMPTISYHQRLQVRAVDGIILQTITFSPTLLRPNIRYRK